VCDAGTQGQQTEPVPSSPDLEASVTAAIAACGYDLRATIRALIVANAYLEKALRRAEAAASRGYLSRGRRRR
jgi:hypothetical protein